MSESDFALILFRHIFDFFVINLILDKTYFVNYREYLMSIWEDRVNNHPLNSTLDNLNNVLEEILEDQDILPDNHDRLLRIQQILLWINTFIESIDPEIVPPALLADLQNLVQPVYNQLKAFRNNRNQQHIVNTESQIDTLLNNVRVQSVFLKPLSDSGMNSTITSFRKSVGGHKSYINRLATGIKSDLKQTQAELNRLKDEIVSQKNRNDNIISEYQKQFSTSEEKRREDFTIDQKNKFDEFNKKIEFIEDASELVIENIKARSQEAHGKFNEDSQKLLERIANERQRELEKFDKDSKILTEDIISLSNETKEHLTKKKDEVETLANVVASTAMSGGYKRVANVASIVKIIWQCVTVISIGGLIYFAISIFNSASKPDFSMVIFGAKSFTVFSFGVLAAYAARQAERSASFERKNRILELEFASIDPFLAKLPEDKQVEVKLALSEKWFGNKEEMVTKTTEKNSGKIFDFVEMVFKFVKD